MATSEQNSSTRDCPACGKRHAATFATCPFCGARAAPVRDYAAIAESAIAHARPFVSLTWHPASVVTLDLFFDLNWGDTGLAPDADAWHPTPAQQKVITTLGAFFGELIRREFGGAWQDDPQNRDDVLRSRLVLPNGAKVYPISRAWKRMKSGAAENFELLYVMVRRAAGAVPAADEAAGWMEQARYFANIGRADLALAFCDRAGALGVDAAMRAEIDGIRARAQAPGEDAAAPAEPEPAAAPVAARAAPPPPPPVRDPEIPLDDAVRAALSRAGELVRAGDHAGALAAYDRALELEPAAKAALIGRAGALMALARHAEARTWLDSFAMRSDCEPERSLLAAMAADAVDDVRAAHDLFARVAGDHRLPETHRERAAARVAELAEHPGLLTRALERIDDLGAAVDGYRRFCAAHPDYAEGWRDYGVGLAMLDRGEEALPCFERAIRLEPTEPKSYDHMATTLARLGRLDAAIAVLDEGLRRRPDAVGMKFRKGILQGSGGHNAEALALFAEVIRADPGHPDVWANKADIELREADVAKAIVSIENFLRNNPARIGPRMQAAREKLWSLQHPGRSRDPARAQTLQNRGIGRAVSGDLAAALEDFDAAIAADPLLGHGWFNRAMALARSGRMAEALASCEQAEALLGATAEVADVEVAVLVRLGRIDDAIRCHDRNLAYGKPAPERLRAKAQTLAGNGRPADALPILQGLIAREPFDIGLRRERAAALAAAGRREEAIAAYDTAIRMAPEDAALRAARAAL